MSDGGGSPAIHSTTLEGDGPAIVFLHGLFGQGRNFTQVAKALGEVGTPVLVDLPNHGRSGWTDRVDYVETAATIAAWLRSGPAREGPVAVVGHSMGGKVAMVLALLHPDLVERLVVVDIAPEDSEGAGEFEHLLGSLAGLDLASLERRSDADERLRGPIPDDRVRGFLLQNLRSVDGGFAWQANLEVLRRDLGTIAGFPPVAASFERPVLWLRGEDSAYVREEHLEPMRRLFPRATLVTVKGAGHWVHAERPDTFVSAVKFFISAD